MPRSEKNPTNARAAVSAAARDLASASVFAQRENFPRWMQTRLFEIQDEARRIRVAMDEHLGVDFTGHEKESCSN